MTKEMPDEIELGLFYAPAPMSEHFYSVIDAETKMTPVASAKYVRADKAVPEGGKLVPIEPNDEMIGDGFLDQLSVVSRAFEKLENEQPSGDVKAALDVDAIVKSFYQTNGAECLEYDGECMVEKIAEHILSKCTTPTAQQPDVNSVFDSPELMETLAEIEHERWSGWMRYQFEVANEEKNQHWKSLMNTPYADLQEWSKESDRREVRKTLDAIKKFIGSTVQQPVNKELLEALSIATNELEEHSQCEDCQVGVPLNTLNQCHGALIRAEQKGLV